MFEVDQSGIRMHVWAVRWGPTWGAQDVAVAVAQQALVSEAARAGALAILERVRLRCECKMLSAH